MEEAALEERNDEKETMPSNAGDRLARLKRFSEHFALKKHQLNARCSEAGDRLRKYEINCFNHNIINYLNEAVDNCTTSRHKNELVHYELKRQQEEQHEHDSDATETDDSDLNDDDDDDTTYEPSTSRNSKSPTTDSEVNNTTSELDWFKNRLKLGSEWQRVQTKLKYLKFKNEQLAQHTSSEHEIEKLSNSLKESLNEKFKTTTSQEPVVNPVLAGSVQHHEEPPTENTHKSSRCDLIYNRDERKRPHRLTTNVPLTGKSPVKLDDLLLKTFYLTLVHFRTSLFKRVCFCDEFKQNNSSSTPNSSIRSSIVKTCIFCDFFKKYEHQLADYGRARHQSSSSPEPPSVSSNESIQADERLVKFFHSYSKQHSSTAKSTKVKLTNDKEKLASSVNNQSSCRCDQHIDPTTVNSSRRENSTKSLELDEIEIDPGFDISLEDIKKLPDFTYEE